MSILKRFVLNYNDRFMYQSSSKGNQKKWIYDNKFIKADTYNGYESIAECLAYIVGKHTNIKSIKYLSCIINEVKEYGVESFYGCYSNNFIKEGESLVTVYKILLHYFNSTLINAFYYNYSANKMLEVISKNCSRYTEIDINKILRYFSDICKFDAIILNEDRHLNNIAFIFDGNSFRFSPIFDNGASLLSESGILNESIYYGINRAQSKPFSISFNEQISLFKDLPRIKIDYDSLINELNNVSFQYKEKEFEQDKGVLLYMLERTYLTAWEGK